MTGAEQMARLAVFIACVYNVGGGIIFVHNATMRSNDYSSLTRALIPLYDSEREATWKDRLFFLPPPR